MKCLPQAKVKEAKGNVLHDWHAEVLALRAFNRWIVDECAYLAANTRDGGETMGRWVRWRERSYDKYKQEDTGQEQPFAIHDDVEIHMYCSEAPCGDASMELTMAEQEDATPWPLSTSTSLDNEEGEMLGRGHFDQLGIVRRKPARPDAPPTLSKSCSDKLALKQCTTLLSSLTSRLVWPGNAYLRTLVLPEAQIVPAAVERAFGREGRMKGIADVAGSESWRRAGYGFRPFEVRGTGREFEFSKRCSHNTSTPPGAGAGPSSNLSALYTPYRQEILINGVLQGRKQFDPRGASCVSRRAMWRTTLDLAVMPGLPALAPGMRMESYGEVKAAAESREQVKRDVRTLALKGWKRNVGDEEWVLYEG